MTKEAFKRELLRQLEEERLRRPAMRREDAVKFVFQGMLGVGHLLAARREVTEYIGRETAGLTADPAEPLFEALSPAWCRLNLRRAMAEGLQPDMIAGMMLEDGCGTAFTRQDVYETCRETALAGILPADETEPESILDEHWLPGHSAAYREAYRPAYRVVSAAWMPLAEALLRIAQGLAGKERLLVTLDGPCATGKTTLARKLARVFRGEVMHTDDFVIPHSRKTPEQLAVPGGNCDAERLAGEVTGPFSRGEPVRYRRYDFMNDRLLPEEELPPARLLILEGSYCNLPVIRAHADVRLFLEADWAVRQARLTQRESPASLQRFYDRWIPLENAYFAAYPIESTSDFVL